MQNRAARTEPGTALAPPIGADAADELPAGARTHHGFLVSASDDAQLATLLAQLRELGRVEQMLWLGVVA